MTKEGLKVRLSNGQIIQDLFQLQAGQECTIFKAPDFHIGLEILYIPDLFLHEIPEDSSICRAEDQERILDNCYTGNDFVKMCCGDIEMARCLFDWCDWQSPESAFPEVVAAYAQEPAAALFG